MLDQQTTLSLLKKVKNNDERAKEELIINNIQLVKSIVRKYKYSQVEYDDLMQLGLIGLYKAIKNFDESFNVRFSTYAVPMIVGEIKRFLRDDGIIKVSRSTKVLASKIQSYINEIVSSTGESPSVNDIANKFNKSESTIKKLGQGRANKQEYLKYPLRSFKAENKEIFKKYFI